MENNGYIKLYRKVLDNPVICKDSDHFAIWVYLLLKATHDNYDSLFGSERITLNSGQLITGRKTIANDLHINESKVERVLMLLKNEHQIEQRTSTKNRLITILKWNDYQFVEQQDKQQMNNERTTSEQQVNTYKNVKNVNNDKNKDIVFVEYAKSDNELLRTLNEFEEMRNKLKKPMTIKAKELLIKKLDKLSVHYDRIELLNQSIMNSWLDVYELKKKNNSNRVEQITNYETHSKLLSEEELSDLESSLKKIK